MRRTAIFVAAAIAAACAGQATPAPPPTLTSRAPAPTPTPEGLASAPEATASGPARRWYTLPDGAFREEPAVSVAFAVDPTAGRPRARLRSTGRAVDLAPTAAGWTGTVPLEGAKPGEQVVEIVVRLRDGSDAVVATRPFTLSAPEYVVWTLDFEGDDAGDAEMANTAEIADRLGVPMTILWNPRVWTTAQVSAARAGAMLAWTKARAAKGDEVGLHLHAWNDFVQAAGVTPRTRVTWAGRSDGYDVPLTEYSEQEVGKLIALGLRLMNEQGLPRPTSFRAGGLFANAATLRAVAAARFTADCSAAPRGPFGRLQYPWTLARDAQPYYPARDDANAPGDLPVLEAPTIGGNTFGYTEASIGGIVRADLAMLAPAGAPAAERRTLTVVSHPATIDATERAAIETLFRAFEPLRYDRDTGPLRFVTLAQLAKAYGP